VFKSSLPGSVGRTSLEKTKQKGKWGGGGKALSGEFFAPDCMGTKKRSCMSTQGNLSVPGRLQGKSRVAWGEKRKR